MLKKQAHRPAHLFLDNSPYFITASTHKKRPLLNDAIKIQLLELMREAYQSCQWRFEHWVILNNHYHIMVHSDKGEDLSKIIGRIHYKSGQLIRETQGNYKHIWWNYWDYCPRDQNDYWVRLNCLLLNPIKHGYTDNLNDYPFSSFHQLLAETGREALMRQFKDHAEYKNLIVPEDDF